MIVIVQHAGVPAVAFMLAMSWSVLHAAEAQRLLAASKERGERELNLSWSGGSTLGGHEGVKKFEALFNRMYGTNIKMHFTPGPSFTVMAGKVTQEVIAGRRASTDILVGTQSHFGDLVDRNVLEEYDYAKLGLRVTKAMVAPRNIGVEILGTVSGIYYNGNLIPPAEIPKRLEDILNPKWKGKVASTVNVSYFPEIAYRPEWTPEKMKAFAIRLSDHIGGLIGMGEQGERIISGEFVMLVMGGSGAGSRFEGSPLRFAVLEDAAVLRFHYLGVPRNTPNSNLTKLFINTVLSEEGQRINYQFTALDHYELAGSQSVTLLDDLKAKGIKPLRVDAKFVADHAEMGKFENELRRILHSKPGS